MNNYDVLDTEPCINFVKGFANRCTFWYSSSLIPLLLTAIELNHDLTPTGPSIVPIDLEVLVYALELRPYLLVKFWPLIFNYRKESSIVICLPRQCDVRCCAIVRAQWCKLRPSTIPFILKHLDTEFSISFVKDQAAAILSVIDADC